MSRERDGYRWYFGDLRTGKISRSVDLINTRWGDSIDSPSNLEGSFPLGSGEWPYARADAAPAKSFMAVAHVKDGVETFLAGGPVWTAKHVDDSSDMLTLNGAGLGSYFDHRKVIPVLAGGESAATVSLTYEGAQLGLIAKRLVELAQSHTAGELPIVLPDDADLGGAGSAHTRTYPGYELAWVSDRLRQLSEVQDGPEIQFVPRRRTDDPRYLEWVMRIGVEPTMILAQDGPPWVFDRSVPNSPIAQIDVQSNGSLMASRMWAAGEGEGEGRPIVAADSGFLTDLGYPLLEGEVTGINTVSKISTLSGHAESGLAVSGSPVETWSVTVKASGRPNVGQYLPGDWCTVRLRNHSYLLSGDYSMRILSRTGDSSDFVTLALTARLGAL